MNSSKYTSRLEIVKEKKPKIIEKGIWSPTSEEWRDVLEDYIRIMRVRYDNKFSMLKMQMLIMEDLLAIQDFVQHGEKLKAKPDDPELLEQVQGDFNIESIDFQINQQEIIREGLVDIINAHLWRILEFNRPLISFLGQHESTGNISRDIGFIREFQEFAFSANKLDVSHFLLNELSGQARIGDLIVKRFNGAIDVIEVKASASTRGKKRKERLKRQEEKRKSFISLANNGNTTFKGDKISVVKIKSPKKHYLKKLNGLLSEVEKSGIATVSISKYLSLVAIDWGRALNKSRYENKFQLIHDTIIKPWKDRGDKFYIFDHNDKSKISVIGAPFSIFPIPEKYIADILVRKKWVSYYFNFSRFGAILEASGWQIISSIFNESENKNLNSLLDLQKGPCTISITFDLFSQIVFELLTMSSFIQILNYLYKNRVSEISLIVHENEKLIWR